MHSLVRRIVTNNEIRIVNIQFKVSKGTKKLIVSITILDTIQIWHRLEAVK